LILLFYGDFTSMNATLNISWEHTSVALPIQTNTDKVFKKLVSEEFLNKHADHTTEAAEYYLYINLDLESGTALINKALEIEKSSSYYRVKTDLLRKAKRYQEGLATHKEQISYIKTNPENWNPQQMDSVLAALAQNRERYFEYNGGVG
jgi:hypothetical protein